MPPSDPSSSGISKCISDLRELAHELSNSLGMTMNHLVLEAERRGKASANLKAAIELSVRSAEALRSLMVELQRLDLALVRAEPFKKGTSP